MPGRQLTGSENYRYAYQGQEKDPETGKEAFQLRLWDGRIGRWLTTDPALQFVSPYIGMGNDPIKYYDKNGDWIDNGDGSYTAQPGDGAWTLARDAHIPYEQALAILESQNKGTYIEDGILKSKVIVNDIIVITERVVLINQMKEVMNGGHQNQIAQKMALINKQNVLRKKANQQMDEASAYIQFSANMQRGTPDPTMHVNTNYGASASTAMLSVSALNKGIKYSSEANALQPRIDDLTESINNFEFVEKIFITGDVNNGEFFINELPSQYFRQNIMQENSYEILSPRFF